MIRRRDFFWSLLIAAGWLLLLLVATDASAVMKLRGYLRQFHGPGSENWIPVIPYTVAVAKIIFFHIFLGIVIGIFLYGMMRVLVSERGEDGRWVVSRRPYYIAYLVGLFAVTAYLQFQAMLIYPGLWDSSWQWAAFAGSPGFVTAFGLLGKVGVVIACLLVLLKRKDDRGWVLRWGWIPVAMIIAVAFPWDKLSWTPQPKPANRGPNVILIGIDSVRPDHVSGLGYSRNTTPNLDRFLKDSVTFTNAFVPLARTGPSWISILTGCYPTRNGHRDDLSPKESRIPPVATLANHLEKLGYYTSFFLDNSNFMSVDPELGFKDIGQPDPNVVWFGLSFFPLHLSLYYYCLNNPLGFCYAPMLHANQAFSAVYNWRYFANDIERELVRMKGQEKFFLAAHTCIVHAPFSVRYPYSTYFAPPPPAPRNRFVFRFPFEMILAYQEILRRTKGREWPLLFSQEINLYDALMRETDDWLGSVLDSIRRLDLYDTSLIVVMADHGEDLFRKDHFYHYITSNHGFHVWGDDGYRVVMAVKLPKSAGAGGQVPWLVRSIDVAPTVLDALGLPPLPEAQGVSLVPQLKNPKADPGLTAYIEAGLTLEDWFIPDHRPYPFDHWVFFQYVDPASLRIYRRQEYMPGFVMAKDRVLRTERWKIIAYPMRGPGPLPFQTTLHDVEHDPTNRTDYSTSEPAVLAEMRLRLAPYIDADARTYGFEWRWMNALTTAPLSLYGEGM